MPTIPLISPGSRLLDTGIRTAQTARLTAGAGAAAWGKALQGVGQQVAEIAQERQQANDATALVDLESQMRGLQSQQVQFQNDNVDQESWGGHWEKLTAGFQKTLDDTALSPQARLTARQTFDRFSQGQALDIQQQANGQAFRRMEMSLKTRAQSATSPDDIDQLRPLWISGGGMPEAWDAFATPLKTQKNADIATNGIKSAILSGNPEALEAAIKYGQDYAGWDKSLAEAQRLSGAEGIERTREVNKSRSRAEFMGEVMMRKAQGETIVPAQVESWVKENRIDKDTGARLMVALKSEQGAMQGEFYDFLSTTVDAYDPKTDPDGRKAHEIRIQAFHMGLNQIQMGYFHNRLDHAAKLNGPQRAEQAVLSAGKKVIGDMLKDVGKTRSWDSDAETLLKDPAKLEAYGIPAEKAAEIKALISGTKGGWFSESQQADKAKALSLFRQQAATRVPNKPAGLTKAEWNKMNALTEGDDTPDPNANISAEFSRAVLEEGLESWYNYERNKRGTPPTDHEVKDWVGRETRAVLQGGNLGSLFGMSDQASSSGSGLDEGTVELVKGFEGFTPNAYGDFKQTSVGYGTRARFEGETLTEREADTRLREELTMHAKRVDALVQKYGTKLTPEQRGALVSFDFNTGAVHRLFERAGSDTAQWPAIMREFKKAGGKDVAGLITRRGKEASFFE